MLTFKRVDKNVIIPEKIDDFSYKIFCSSFFTLRPFARITINTGISFSFKTGNFGIFHPKQSLFTTHGVLSPIKIFNSDEVLLVDLVNLAILGTELNPSNQNLIFGSLNDFKLSSGAELGYIKVACSI